MTTTFLLRRAAIGAALTSALAGCGSDSNGSSTTTTPVATSASIDGIVQPQVHDGTVRLENCGKQIELPAPAERVFANDGNIISIALAVGAAPQLAAVSSVQRDKPVLARHFGADAVDGLKDVSKEYPSKETVIAQRPDVFFAGWNYGYDEATGLTPAGLAKHGIDTYTLTESCRQGKGSARGITDPWTALRTDLVNVGAFTGHSAEATKAVEELDTRLDALKAAPQPTKKPVVFLFDSGTKTIYSSGRLGAPQAIIDAAGGRNAMEGLKDTWTEVSWEQLTRAKPDAFVFVDYPPQTFEQKVALLRRRAGVKTLPAVKQGRFLDLPYAHWTSGPLNVDAAEQLRAALERWKLVPASGITPKFDDAIALER
ncbi:MAG: ABC transporter substrate-binding protein [Patulibacter sp.]